MSNFRTLRGLGVSGTAEGHTLLLGNQALLKEHGVEILCPGTRPESSGSQGATRFCLPLMARPRRCWQFAIRYADSVQALQRLHHAGYRLVMLTGDNPVTANAIAREAGIDEVIAGVLPDGKADAIKTLQSQGRPGGDGR